MIPFYPMIFPMIPIMNEKPPTIYSLLNSIVNYGKAENEQTKIKDLAKKGRETFFDFDYPLTTNIKKEDFECMILNHFIMRRIGFDTLTAFKIQLNVKLNEIMPFYNKMFDALENWKIFDDGEKTIRTTTENGNSDTTNTLENTSETTTNQTSDNRESELPQNEIDNLKDGSYLTKYNLNTNTDSSNDKSTSNGKSTNTSTNNVDETITKTPADKIAIYNQFKENLTTIYGSIFKDLECLFYQLV